MTLPRAETTWITQLMAGRNWVWIQGNHDPGPIAFAGRHLTRLNDGPLTFCQIASPAETPEISGHYHPKARISLGGRSLSRPAFSIDKQR